MLFNILDSISLLKILFINFFEKILSLFSPLKDKLFKNASSDNYYLIYISLTYNMNLHTIKVIKTIKL